MKDEQGNEIVDKVQESDIADVLEGMGMPVKEEPPKEELPKEEPPKVEPPKVEEPPKKEEPPKVEPPKVEPPKEEPPKVEPPKVEPPKEEDELAKIKRENEELRKTILEAVKPPVVKEVPKTPEQKAAEEEANKNRAPIVLPFFKEENDIDEAFKTVESANKFMTGVVATAVEFVTRQIPTLVTRVSDQQVNTRLAIKEFYDNNKDLLPYREYCGFITNKVTAEHPEFTIGQVFEEVSKQTRQALKLASAAGENLPGGGGGQDNGGAGGVAPKGKGPALPPSSGGGGRRGAPPKLEGVEKEIADLIN